MYEAVIKQLDGLRQQSWGYKALCPAHEDRHQSLSVRQSEKTGDLLLRCHAGCSFEQIVTALGVTWKDCCTLRPREARRRMDAYYDYQDEQGRLLYQVVRFNGKNFAQRIPDGHGGWSWGLGDTRRVLYRLPLLVANPNRVVLVVEGEKDVDRLIHEGCIATTSPMGAGKWLASYNASLKGRTVVIIPDNDPQGLLHATLTSRHLSTVARQVVVVELPGLTEQGQDVSDWLNQVGTIEDLQKLCRQALHGDNGMSPLINQIRKLGRHDQVIVAKTILTDLE